MVPQMFFLGMVGGWQLVIILVVVLILFGGKKIPELMKGLGEGIREFNKAKSEKTTSPTIRLTRNKTRRTYLFIIPEGL